MGVGLTFERKADVESCVRVCEQRREKRRGIEDSLRLHFVSVWFRLALVMRLCSAAAQLKIDLFRL